MTFRLRLLSSVLIVAWLLVIASDTTGADIPTRMEQTLAIVQNTMAASPGAWPQTWHREYVDTIRRTLTQHRESPDFILRLDILEKGFPPCWADIEKSRSRTWFDVQCVQTRWYTEHLMATALPSEKDRDTLRRQWTDLWREAVRSLLSQFSFLDPNVVYAAQTHHLRDCLRCIEAPLIPIFQRPFTAEQLDHLKQGWHEMRYVRVDLMRQLGGEGVFTVDGHPEHVLTEHPHYLLTQRSLAQLLGCVWRTVAHPPDYHAQAIQKQREEQRRRRQTISVARAQENRLVSRRFRQLPQAECLGFLLAVLMESPRHVRNPPAADAPQAAHRDAAETPPKEVMLMR